MSLQTLKDKLLIRLNKRFEEGSTNILGFPVKFVDKSSFLFMYEEIFESEVYKFKTDTDTPCIIDCGANIGLSTIYFKRRFPNAEIISFEPDPIIFNILENNIRASRAEQGVTCIQACLAKEAGEVNFYPDGADGGTMSYQNVKAHAITVPAMRLDGYITKPVDFLKMDIEGAECEVLDSITHKLSLVKRMFIEYHSFAEQTQNLDTILEKLTNAGFRYYLEHIGIRSAAPYIERSVDHGMDLQINIFAYRI